MPADMIFYLALGAAAGGFINGLAGTGTALFAMGFYLVVLDPITAVAIVSLMSILAGVQGVWIVRTAVFDHPKRLARFVLPAFFGVPVGLALLTIIEPRALRLAIAALLILYGGYFGFRSSLPAFKRKTPMADCFVGLAGGILGGAAGVSGALPSIWMSLRPWSKTEMRAVLQPFNMIILTTTVILLAFRGAYDHTAMLSLLITVPCGLVAAQAGISVFKRLNNDSFRRLLILLSLMMGVGILLTEVT